jgi:hypothetical protein
MAICHACGLHGQHYILAAGRRDAVEESRRRQQFHGARSVSDLISRSFPIRALVSLIRATCGTALE